MKLGLPLMLVTLAAASLGGCGKPGREDGGEADAFAATAGRAEDQFGPEFGKAYRADPNSEPNVVAEGALAPVSLTSEPVAID